MEEKKNPESKNSNKKITLIIILAVLIIALIVLAVINPAKNKKINNGDINGIGQTNQVANSQADDTITAPISGEITPSTPTTSGISGETPAVDETPAVEGSTGATSVTEKKIEAPIEKTNPITIKMTIDADKGFNPASFDVKAGQQVTLNITSNGGVAIVVFDGGLSASAIGISNGQTKDVTFNAPTTRGEYSFHNDIPGKSQTCKINVK